ncbi:protein HOTHEAD-like [Andrographis paniculata]|uniref:protein HOTHEAD-like n=1 Tax=Andrographis paniculata TaxID=175694 RepID=UPI0021E7A46C|nr:protein HOTHEAD-like [Andrographis paniculata]
MGFPTLPSLIGIFFLIASGFAEKAPYSFVREGTSAPPVEYSDYIVVGGGTAGTPLAATLSAATAKVLLLERGGQPYGNPSVTNINGFGRTLADPSPTSPAQQFVTADGVFNNRPRILGGGTAVNAGFYSRAEPEFLSRLGLEPRLVEESYRWVEDKIVFRPLVRQWQAGFRGGLVEAGVVPDRGFTYEHLMGTKVGGTIFDENGTRHSAADLLEYANSNNIVVYLNSIVQKILFRTSPGQKPKAIGVIFKDSAGVLHEARLNNGSSNEIIVASGALGSPPLLMMSGIGPGRQLQAHQIPIVLRQPYVGRNMVDNPFNGVIFPSRRQLEYSLVEVAGLPDTNNYLESISMSLNFSALHASAQNYAKIANTTLPTFEIPNNIYLPSGVNTTTPFQAGQLLEKIKTPFSKGDIELENRDPDRTQRVTFNYLKDSRDVASCVEGLKIIKRVTESNSLSSFRYPLASFTTYLALGLAFPTNLNVKRLSSLYSLSHYCVDTVRTTWHYHGGCQAGKVVDRDYKVIGVDALRVVDASTYDQSPGTNPQATIMMLGRYMGIKILQQRSN